MSDPWGHILAETRSDAAPFATLVADVPDLHRETPYARWGDWFAWLALAIFGRTTLQIFRRRVPSPP